MWPLRLPASPKILDASLHATLALGSIGAPLNSPIFSSPAVPNSVPFGAQLQLFDRFLEPGIPGAFFFLLRSAASIAWARQRSDLVAAGLVLRSNCG